MNAAIRIGLIGDYNEAVRAHRAIPKVLVLAGEAAGCRVESVWLATTSLNPPLQLASFAGLWCVPASPYANMEGALGAIQWAREHDVAFLGTCGGFQHALIEYGRNVLGLREADHAESNPGARLPLIAPLACSLVDVKGRIRIQPGTQAAAIFGALDTQEEYHCNYGLNPRFEARWNAGPMQITGRDEEGGARIVELTGHRFYVATLFQPELRKYGVHPLIVEFVRNAK